jgi:hypothetical protein
MSVPVEPAHLLNPDPEVIVKLIDRVVNRPWPEDPALFDAYFTGIGCTPGPGFEHPDDLPESTRGTLLMPGVPIEHGLWGALDGRLFTLGFFFYPGMQGSRALSDIGYRAVQDRLSTLYGDPSDETAQGDGNRSALWTVHGTSVSLYAHVNLAPALQLGLEHAELTAAHDQRFIDKRGY